MTINSLETSSFQEIAANWDHNHRYTPAPRHRRKIILNLLKKLSFKDCLDAGCAQPYLLEEITHRFPVTGYGCDISTIVVNQNKQRAPQFEFLNLNLEKEQWPNNKQFDLVISSEVIEHIADWKSALTNLAAMSGRYLLITVPSGKIRKIDALVGHFKHFETTELTSEIEKHGFTCLHTIQHGFPIHSFYKRLINSVGSDKIYQAYDGGKKYSLFQKVVSQLLYYLFYVDYLFSGGNQIIILAERNATT